MPGRLEPARINAQGPGPWHGTNQQRKQSKAYYKQKGDSHLARERESSRTHSTAAMEGLIPFVIDAIRRSNERSGYRSVSSDGGSSRGGGSRRHLIDYYELPDAAAAASVVEGPSAYGTLHRRARSEFVQGAGVRRVEEHGRAAAVVAGSAYRRK
nr:uncharacterized protein LOC117845707 [Setaria viridis]